MFKSIQIALCCLLVISISANAQHDEVKYKIVNRNYVSFLERTHIGYSLHTIAAKQQRGATPFFRYCHYRRI